MYMGELVRQVLVDLMKDDLIFVGADRSEPIVKDKLIYCGKGNKKKA